ncbi:MAG: translation initiation factor IF-2, partial [Thermoproteota archaeon]
QRNLDNELYEIMGDFSREGFATERFDNVKDFTKTAAIVPTSAKTGEGITELLAVLVGLAQQYLKKRLQTTEGPAKGTVLEVKEEPGLGLTINTILYDGVLGKDDLIVVGGKKEPIVTRIRTILVPKALDEIRDPRDRFSSVNSVSAAAGIKVVAPDLEGAVAGAPLYAVPEGEELEEYIKLVSKEIERIRISTDIDGVVLKADTLGSLEAAAESLKRKDIPIRLADVGDVSKRDVVEASVVKRNKPLYGVILAFNVKVFPDAEEEAKTRDIQVFQESIIYQLVEEYLSWLKAQRRAKLEEEFDRLIMPGKIRILKGYVFRRAKPAVVGVEVLAGKITPKYRLVRAQDGQDVGFIKQIQDKGEALPQAEKGMEVAISLDEPTVGRHIFEGDTLFVKVPEEDAKKLRTKFMDKLTGEEQEALIDYIKMRRKQMPFWAA